MLQHYKQRILLHCAFTWRYTASRHIVWHKITETKGEDLWLQAHLNSRLEQTENTISL